MNADRHEGVDQSAAVKPTPASDDAVRAALNHAALIELRFEDRRVLLAPHVGGAIAVFYDLPDDGGSSHGALHWLRSVSAEALAAYNPLGMASFSVAAVLQLAARRAFCFREVDLSADGNAFDHALHGHAWRRPWRVGSVSPTMVELHLDHEPGSEPAHHWPYRYEATQSFELDNSGLFVTMSIRNLADQPMPFGMGHHPYYPRTPATRIHTNVRAMWHATQDLLPTLLGAYPIDALASPEGLPADAYDLDNNFAGWSRSATIDWPDERRSVTLYADAPFDHMVLYAPGPAVRGACNEYGGFPEP